MQVLRLDHFAVKKVYWEGLGRKIYGESLKLGGVDSDLIILAGGEKDKQRGIWCHKKILSGCSPVFEAMFRADISESRENCGEIVDMTEAGVGAMLQFINDGDLEKALEKCEIALELMDAGHKYQIDYLEDAMMQIISAKPVDWLSDDLTLKLLQFTRSVDGKFKKTEKIILEILKWHAQKSRSLMESKEYQWLFSEYPRVAMELGQS